MEKKKKKKKQQRQDEKAGRGLEPNEWWLVLSCLADHRSQARCAAVSKEWRAICATLPKLHIQVPRAFGEAQARRFIQAALDGRSCLRELHLDLDLTLQEEPQPRAPFRISEHHIFDLLQRVSSSMEELRLTLRDTSYRELWPRLSEHFSKLQRLRIWYGFIVNPPLDLHFPNLKEIELMWGGNVYAPIVDSILKSCSFLQKLNISDFIGPLVVESHSLLSLTLIGKVPSGPWQSDLVIKASNLKHLVVLNSRDAKVYESNGLKTLWLSCNEVFMDHPQPNLQSLHISKPRTKMNIDFSHVLKLVSTAKDLKWLKIEGAYSHISDLTLQQLIPEQVEVLLFDAMLLRNLIADEPFRKQNVYDILQLLDSQHDVGKLPRFNLKKVAVDMHDLEFEDIGTYLLEIVVQLLRCSPKLKFLVIRPPSTASILLEDCGFAYVDRYVDSCHVCWEADCHFGVKCDTPCFDTLYKCVL